MMSRPCVGWTADEGVACRSEKELNKRLSRRAFITQLYRQYFDTRAAALMARIEIYFHADSLPINARRGRVKLAPPLFLAPFPNARQFFCLQTSAEAFLQIDFPQQKQSEGSPNQFSILRSFVG